MVDIGLAAKKTMALHAAIKLLLKSPFYPAFILCHSVLYLARTYKSLAVT